MWSNGATLNRRKIRPELARNWSAARRRLLSVSVALSFSDGATQFMNKFFRVPCTAEYFELRNRQHKSPTHKSPRHNSAGLAQGKRFCGWISSRELRESEGQLLCDCEFCGQNDIDQALDGGPDLDEPRVPSDDNRSRIRLQ